MYELQPSARESTGVSAEDLARVTAAGAFAEADTNSDGQLSFAEFREWYTTAGPSLMQ